jgi:hypothetical protein
MQACAAGCALTYLTILKLQLVSKMVVGLRLKASVGSPYTASAQAQ